MAGKGAIGAFLSTVGEAGSKYALGQMKSAADAKAEEAKHKMDLALEEAKQKNRVKIQEIKNLKPSTKGKSAEVAKAEKLFRDILPRKVSREIGEEGLASSIADMENEINNGVGYANAVKNKLSALMQQYNVAMPMEKPNTTINDWLDMAKRNWGALGTDKPFVSPQDVANEREGYTPDTPAAPAAPAAPVEIKRPVTTKPAGVGIPKPTRIPTPPGSSPTLNVYQTYLDRANELIASGQYSREKLIQDLKSKNIPDQYLTEEYIPSKR